MTAARGAAAARAAKVRPAWTLAEAPVRPWATSRAAVPPGIGPLEPDEWLFGGPDAPGQLAIRDRLLDEGDDALGPVHMVEGGEAAAEELRDAVIAAAEAQGLARRDGDAMIRADGGRVTLDGPPMAVAGRLGAEDWLVMEKRDGEGEHVLTAGVLCFPAHWRLDEKIGRPLLRIHMPVPEYPGELARRVQRFFDGVKVGRPLMRANWHFAASPEIVTPAHEAEKTANFSARLADSDGPGWLRVERQTVLRLPRTGAVVFGVRTLMTDASALPEADWADIGDRLAEVAPEDAARKAGPALRRRAAEAARRRAAA